MIYITSDQKKIILNILTGQFQIRAYGSRAKGTHQPFSDLDLALIGSEKLTFSLLSKLRTALDESDLPFHVDLIDYHSISDSFREVIDADGVDFISENPE